jgi:hypothetical protein
MVPADKIIRFIIAAVIDVHEIQNTNNCCNDKTNDFICRNHIFFIFSPL